MSQQVTPQTKSSEKNSEKKSKSRWVWIACLIFLLLLGIQFISRPVWHVFQAYSADENDREPTRSGFVDDASAMNETSVRNIWKIPKSAVEAEEQLGQLLEIAAQKQIPVSIAGARHSMGGHTFSPNGIVVDMLPFNEMAYDMESTLLSVQSGAIWHDVIEYLEPFGRSVAIMQSNDSFSVGGSLSVNCHGWQFGKPPIASTVESFRIMIADGKILTCSRLQNEELFSLALGGYGLFGIILDAELRTVPNRRYAVERFVMPAVDALETFEDEVLTRENVEMVYARMDISSENFLNEVMIYVLEIDPGEDGKIPPLKEKGLVSLRRSIFRGSVNSEYGKRLRWNAETTLQPKVSPTHYSRNQLLSEGVETFQNRSADSTDILHEYFVPRSGLVGFVQDLQAIIPEYENDLLNVTIRYLEEDQDTFLRYADQTMFSLVMLFNQPRTAAGDEEMLQMTIDLVNAVLSRGGRYYLPYRLHPSLKQFHRAYPQAREFFALKRKHDPKELFTNLFYRKYGK